MKLNKVLLLLLILSICVTCLVACGTPTFTVQFDLAGGTLKDVDLTNGLTVEEGTTLDLSQYQPTKANHTFNGWKSGETSYSATDTVVVTADLHLTAQWIDDIAVALDEAKTTAKAALESYKDANNYRDAQKTELATAVTNGKTAIDNATDLAGVETALANAKTVIDEIKTDAELTAEEKALAIANAKTSAKATLETYVSASAYRPAQQTELATAVTNGKTAIDNATDLAGVEAALANAKTAVDAIETDAQITAKEPTITTTLSNGAVFTNTKATIDVWAKTATGTKLNKANVSVTVNGVAMSVNWDDNEKTSYNFVFVEGENAVVITAIDGAYTKTASYTVTCDLTAPTKITIAVEGFSIGIGYIIEPYTVVLDEQTLSEMASMYNYASAKEMKNNLTAAYVLDYVLQSNGLEMDYQGKLHSGGGFYMESMSGIDTSNIAIPEELTAKLLENGYYWEDYVYEEGTLGEFDLTFGSGWMYTINNVFPNVGFCDYIPQDGDVMRIQFTLAYGADIGTTMVGDLWFETVNRDNLTVLISKALEAGVDITDALEVISTFGVTQSNLDTAYQALEVAIKAMPEMLANAKTTAKATLESYKDASAYRDAQKTELAAAVANGKTAIDNATNLAGVEAALANAKAAIDAIKTDAELTAEETAQALANAKTTAKATLDTYVDANNYRPAQQEELATAIANGKTAIDNATDLAGVEAALANAKTAIDAIKTDAELTEEEKANAPTIWTDLKEDTVYASTQSLLSVKAHSADGKKLMKENLSVTVNGVAMSVNWDDGDLTSYNLVLTEGQNVIVIVATYGEYSTTATYTITCNPEAETSIVIAVEAFSVGLGYVVRPYKLTFNTQTLTEMASYFGFADANTMKQNLNGAYALEYVIYKSGYSSRYTGDPSDSYYLSAVIGVDTANPVISQEVEDGLMSVGMWISEYEVMTEGTLSEMDFSQYSGWMYGVNGVALNVGFDQYVPQNGDVVRVQFTLAWGMDVGLQGGLGMGMGSIFPELNKDELTVLVAEALARGINIEEELQIAYLLDTDQETIDGAVASLKAKLQ